MATTPGSASRLNVLSGAAKIVSITNDEKTTLAATVLPDGLLLKDEDGRLYLTDGSTQVQNLQPIVDTNIDPLTENMRTALDKTFSGDAGVYKATEGGMVILGAAGSDGNPKIDDKQLNLVDPDGHLVGEYLKEVLTDENGIVKLDKLPDQMRRHMVFVETYADLASLTATQKLDLIFVADASADPTVVSGWAIYAYNVSDGVASGDPIKIAEGEGLDIDLDAIASNYENVQKAGAVMYDHPVMITPPTLTELVSLIEASQPAENHDTVTVQSKPENYSGATQADVACGLVLSGTEEGSFTVTLTGANCLLKDNGGEPQATLTKTDTLTNINSWLTNVTVQIGSSAGNVTLTSDKITDPVVIGVVVADA